MKHLRFALESEEVRQDEEATVQLAESIDALANIAEVDTSDEGPSEVSMESLFSSISGPSAKLRQFKLAMESASAGVWALIAAGIAAVLAIVYKAVTWFGGSSSGGGGGGGGIAKAEEKLADGKKTIDKDLKAKENVEKIVQHTAPKVEVDGKETTVRCLGDIIKLDFKLRHEIMSACEKHGRFYLSTANKDQFVKFVEDLEKNESGLQKRAEAIGTNYRAATVNLKRITDNIASVSVQEIEQATKELNDFEDRLVGSDLRFVGSNDYTFGTLSTEMEQLFKYSIDKNVPEDGSIFEEMYINMKSYYDHRSLKEALEDRKVAIAFSEKMGKDLETMNKAAMALKELTQTEEGATDVEKAYAHYAAAVKKKTHGAADVIRFMVTSTKLIVRFVDGLEAAKNHADHVMLKVFEALKGSTYLSAENKAEVEEAYASIKEYMKNKG